MTSSLALSDNHICFTSEQDLKTMCQAELGQYGVSYFEYLRVYDDGRCILLANNQKLVRYVFDTELPVLAPVQDQYINKKFHYLILPVEKYVKALDDAINYFNLSNFINLVERYEGHIDLYCFGADANNASIINFYLNNLDKLEKFKFYFQEKSKSLVKNALKSHIKLPANMEPLFKGMSGKSSHLTQRQVDCLHYLLKGMTVKQIATELSLSPRTVEHYLEAVKNKLSCNSRIELFKKARELGI